MNKYHINGEGNVGLCTAARGNCPFGGSEDHYSSPNRARQAYEEKMGGSAPFERKGILSAHREKKGLKRQAQGESLRTDWASLGFTLKEDVAPEVASLIWSEPETNELMDYRRQKKLKAHTNLFTYRPAYEGPNLVGKSYPVTVTLKMDNSTGQLWSTAVLTYGNVHYPDAAALRVDHYGSNLEEALRKIQRLSNQIFDHFPKTTLGKDSGPATGLSAPPLLGDPADNARARMGTFGTLATPTENAFLNNYRRIHGEGGDWTDNQVLQEMLLANPLGHDTFADEVLEGQSPGANTRA